MSGQPWPTARDFSEVLQNPSVTFSSPVLKGLSPSLDRLGMPVIACGNFAAVCKMNNDVDSFAVRFFTRNPGDRENRYRLIDRYLSSHNISAIAEFEYKPNEVLVMGRRYPIVQMEWIRGTRLDLCVESNLSRNGAMEALADEWLGLVRSLREAQIAHGDLQHGNVLHDGTGLKLVDLDGMFVPGMEGLSACEEGHRFYQHPERQHASFDSDLDRFPALVIYLSLIALDKKPDLWGRFHDENLIFTRNDFLDPGASPLFGLLRRDPGKVGQVCEALMDACRRRPSDTPNLLALADSKPRTNLPGWIRGASSVNVTVTSREAASAAKDEVESRPGEENPSWTPWGTQQQTVGTTPAPQPTMYPSGIASPSVDWRKILSASIPAAMAWCFYGCFLAIPWILHALMQGLGIVGRNAGWGTVLAVYVSAAYALSVRLLYKKEVEEKTKPKPVSSSPTVTIPTITWSTRSPYAGTVIASSIRNKYHRPTCRWARKIARNNRIAYASPAAARQAGRHPCGECRP